MESIASLDREKSNFFDHHDPELDDNDGMPTQIAHASERSREARRSQVERSETTIEQLIGVARRLFATKGFSSTSIHEIVEQAGMTRGALYHHFSSKEELFEAVFQREQEALNTRVRTAAMRKKSAWAQLKAGCDEFLHATLDPETQQILMLDGPAVLGPQFRQSEEPHAIALLKGVVEKAMHEGALRKRPVMPLVHLLFGALCQGAMVIARADDQEETTRAMRQEIRRLLDAIEAA